MKENEKELFDIEKYKHLDGVYHLEDEQLSDMQNFYMQYNAHVNEEQLSHTLVDYIESEIKN